MKDHRVYAFDPLKTGSFKGERMEYSRNMTADGAQDLIDSLHTAGTDLVYFSGRSHVQVGHLGAWMGRDANGAHARNFFHHKPNTSSPSHENKRNDAHAKNGPMESHHQAGRKPSDVLRHRAREQAQPQEPHGLYLPASGFGLAGPTAQPSAATASRGVRTFARNPTFNLTH